MVEEAPAFVRRIRRVYDAKISINYPSRSPVLFEVEKERKKCLRIRKRGKYERLSAGVNYIET